MGFVVMAEGRKVPGIPTPQLIESGGGEAYFVPSETIKSGGVWYLRTPTHVSPTGEYANVRVFETSDWRVALNITAIEAGHEDEADAYTETFYVEAITRQNAEDLAVDMARADIARQYGHDDFATDIRILRAEKGSRS